MKDKQMIERKEGPTMKELLELRNKALVLNIGFQVMQAEALLDQYYPNWKLSQEVA